jgi:tRNA G18 (ribose-2'-O)-methylase SpoU
MVLSDYSRQKTRRERYDQKLKKRNSFNLSIATTNFMFDENLAFIIRSAACFGVDSIYVLGSVPPRSFLNSRSGSLYDYVSIHSFSNPSELLSHARKKGYDIISLDLTENSTSIYDYNFDFKRKTLMVLGHETTGIPVEISINSRALHIPMPGVGFCLNVSQAGTVAMSEYSRQYLISI